MSKINDLDGDLEQYYVELDTRYKLSIQDNEEMNTFEKLSQDITALLQAEKNWNNAYKIERLLVPLYQDVTLDIEIGRRLTGARKHLGESVFRYYHNNPALASGQGKQALLISLMNDEHRHEITMHSKKDDINYTWYLSIFIFVLNVILFFLPELCSSVNDFLEAAGSGNGKGFYLYTAMSAGAMGAGFSMLIGFRKRLQESHLEELTFGRSGLDLLVRWITGWGAGLILFYFMQSGFLTGTLFPDFSSLSDVLPKLNAEGQKAHALLVIWCFISGFSEKLVPNLLSKAEKGLADSE
ncbi:MAG: hypothetical protein Q9M17_03335 [Mariprofundus sp.]|nr:hypothetical protein [Mariprofundus sp.]